MVTVVTSSTDPVSPADDAAGPLWQAANVSANSAAGTALRAFGIIVSPNRRGAVTPEIRKSVADQARPIVTSLSIPVKYGFPAASGGTVRVCRHGKLRKVSETA